MLPVGFEIIFGSSLLNINFLLKQKNKKIKHKHELVLEDEPCLE